MTHSSGAKVARQHIKGDLTKFAAVALMFSACEGQTGKQDTAVERGGALHGPVGDGDYRPVSASPVRGRQPTRGTDAEDVRDVVMRCRSQIQDCYEQRLGERPDLSGKLTLRLTVAGGRVNNVTVNADTIRDQSLLRCTTLAAENWRFPSWIDDEIILPFSFKVDDLP